MSAVTEHYLLEPEGAELLQTCIHCGLCLQACPTYQVTGKEAESPRGRLLLMKSLDETDWDDPSDHFAHIDTCLGCLGCQSACPSGVPYGDLLEQVRQQQVAKHRPLSFKQRMALKWTTSSPHRRLFTSLLRTIQTLRLDRVAIAFHLLPRSLRLTLAGLPKLPKKAFTDRAVIRFEGNHPNGKSRGTVALFTGCVMDSWFAEVHAATVGVLRHNGYDVALPSGNVCCGALHAHAGMEMTSENNLSLYANLEADAVLINSAGCGAHLKHGEVAKDLPPIYDVVEWLINQGLLPPSKRLADSVTYDAPCHLHHGQGVTRQPIDLLNAACENLVPLAESELCCGSAGLYSISEPELSQQILDRKLGHIMDTGAGTVVTANPGCQMQLRGGLSLGGANIAVSHAIEILDRAYQSAGDYEEKLISG